MTISENHHRLSFVPSHIQKIRANLLNLRLELELEKGLDCVNQLYISLKAEETTIKDTRAVLSLIIIIFNSIRMNSLTIKGQ